MNEYTIKIPISGYVEITVEAENEETAIENAFEFAEVKDIYEWNLHKKIFDGKTCNAILNEMEISKE